MSRHIFATIILFVCDKNGHFVAHWLPSPKFGSGDINKQINSTFLTFHKICQCRSLQKSILNNIRGIIRPILSKVSPTSASFQRLLFSPYGYSRGGACISFRWQAPWLRCFEFSQNYLAPTYARHLLCAKRT